MEKSYCDINERKTCLARGLTSLGRNLEKSKQKRTIMANLWHADNSWYAVFHLCFKCTGPDPHPPPLASSRWYTAQAGCSVSIGY